MREVQSNALELAWLPPRASGSRRINGPCPAWRVPIARRYLRLATTRVEPSTEQRGIGATIPSVSADELRIVPPKFTTPRNLTPHIGTLPWRCTHGPRVHSNPSYDNSQQPTWGGNTTLHVGVCNVPHCHKHVWWHTMCQSEWLLCDLAELTGQRQH